jgi:hypothetical protein
VLIFALPLFNGILMIDEDIEISKREEVEENLSKTKISMIVYTYILLL